MTKRNADYVKTWRDKKGTDRHNTIYKSLREKYRIPSVQACKMKYWSDKRIQIWLIENDYIEVGVV